MARVLVVDDDEGIRKSLRYVLRRAGHAVVLADNAYEALARVNRRPFDVVVTDIVMPGANGVALMERLASVAPSTKVVLMTGEPSVQPAATALRKGAYEYLTKPISSKRLRKVVADAAELKRLQDENRELKKQLEAMRRLPDRAELQQQWLLRAIGEQAPEAIWIIDLAERFAFLNPTAKRLWGMDVPDAEQRPPEEVFTAGSYSALKAIFDHAPARISSPEETESALFILELLQPDGKSMRAETSLTPIYGNSGRLEGLLGVSRTISGAIFQARSAERALKASEGDVADE